MAASYIGVLVQVLDTLLLIQLPDNALRKSLFLSLSPSSLPSFLQHACKINFICMSGLCGYVTAGQYSVVCIHHLLSIQLLMCV